MSPAAYFFIWLAAALAVIAFISATLARQLRLRELRRDTALNMLDVLARYGDWVALQRHTAFFQGAGQAERLLEEFRHLQAQWFPGLANDIVALLAVHADLVDFLWSQQLLRLKDPEAWLESDHDARFMDLWRRQHAAARLPMRKLRLAARGVPSDPVPGSIFAA